MIRCHRSLARALFRCVCVFAVIAGFNLAHAQGRTLKLGHPQSPTSAFHAGAHAFAEEVAKLSGGRFQIQLIPSSGLGGERETVEGVQQGTIDFVVTSTGPIGLFVPETMVTDIPFLFRDTAHARNVLDGEIGQEILARFPSKNMIALAWGENGFRHLTNSKRAVQTPEDLKGLKLRTMENPVHMTAFRALGAVPTAMAFPDVYAALQQGVVDGQENPIPVISSSRFGYVQKHLTLTGHVYSPALIIMSKSLFDGLSAADKKLFQDAAKVGARVMRERVSEIEKSGLAELQAQGVKVVTSVDKERFRAALSRAYAEYGQRFDKAQIERIRDFK